MAEPTFHQPAHRHPMTGSLSGSPGLARKVLSEELRRYLVKHMPRLFSEEPEDWAWKWGYWGRAASAIYCKTNDAELLHQIVSVQRMIAGQREAKARAIALEISGLMILPFTDLLLRAAPGRLPADVRNAMQQTAVNLIEPHMNSMKEDPISGGGYFVRPDDGSIEPQNHQNVYAAAAAEMFALTGDPRFSLVAEKVYRFFKKSWCKEKNGTVSWAYAPRPGNSNMTHAPMRYGNGLEHNLGAEFFSKAAVTIELPVAMYRAKLAPAEDLQLIARSINDNVFYPDYELNYYISPRKIHLCSDEINGPKPLIRYHYLCGFSLLSEFHPGLRDNIEAIVFSRTDLFPSGWYSGAASLMANARQLCR